MYGKIFSSLFTGSMYGAGSTKFALMAYVIANMRPDREVGFQVELNAIDLAHRIGEPLEHILAGIDYLCAPDPASRSGTDQGRRLVKVGSFDYRVVNGAAYAKIRNEEDRRMSNRIRQERFRKKKPSKQLTGDCLAGEREFVKALESGVDEKQLDAIVTDHLPEALR